MANDKWRQAPGFDLLHHIWYYVGKTSEKDKTVEVSLSLDKPCADKDFGRQYSEALILTMKELDKCHIDAMDVGLCEPSRYSDNCDDNSRRRRKRQTTTVAEIKAYLEDPYSDR